MILCSLSCEHPTNRHHVMWPESIYKHSLEKQYRNLPCNIERMCMELHKELHRVLNPPPKPSRDYMREAIKWHKQKKCRCYRKPT